MQTGDLKCNATECAYNQDHKCKSGGIHVSGFGAVSIEGTTCLTFSEVMPSENGNTQESQAFYNKANGVFVSGSTGSVTTPSDIKCEAHNCVYNTDKRCHAKKVQIDENNAYCDTFNYEKHI